MQEQVRKNVPKSNSEASFCLWMLLLTIFEIILVAVVLSRSMGSVAQPTDPPTPKEELTDTTPPADDPKPQIPVFAAGTTVKLPTADASSATVTSEIGSQYAVLIDAESGKILAGKGADTRFAPASMTKVMTLIVACEMLNESDLDREVIMTDEILRYVSSGAYYGTGRAAYEPGLKTKMKDLLYGIGVESFSDCTVMTVASLCPAATVEESERLFVEQMNQKVKDMGLENTHFDNVAGHEGENNYSTASDMAAIMSYALQCPLIKDILSAKSYDYYVWRLEDDGVTYARWTYHFYSTLFNANPKSSSRIKAYEEEYKKEFALSSATFGGGKTGSLGEKTVYTYSLVSYAVKDGKIYVLVTGETSKAYNVMNDAKILYDTYIK